MQQLINALDPAASLVVWIGVLELGSALDVGTSLRGNTTGQGTIIPVLVWIGVLGVGSALSVRKHEPDTTVPVIVWIEVSGLGSSAFAGTSLGEKTTGQTRLYRF